MSEGPRVAVVAAGAALEDWIPEELSFDEWLETETGGWMFNYIDALTLAGVRSVVITHTEHVRTPELFTHRPTGAAVWAVPPVRTLDQVREMERHPLTPIRQGNASDVVRGVRKRWVQYRTTSLRPLLQGIRRTGCDAILTQDYETSRFDACVAMGRLTRLPVFGSFQGVAGTTNAFERRTRRAALAACSGLVIGAQVEIDRVKRKYGIPERKLAKIPNPLDTDLWRPGDRARARADLGIPADARMAISHGRIDIDGKGLDVLFDAWRRVAAGRAGEDLRLMLLGYGPDTATVRQLIASEDLRGAELKEYVVDQDVLRRHLSAADVFAFAGRYEGFPVAPTEAMACGLPVVATAAAGITDIFERGEDAGGIVVAIDDAAGLADGLGRLFDDSDLARELGARARRRVEEFCSLDAVGARLRDFMTERGMRA